MRRRLATSVVARLAAGLTALALAGPPGLLAAPEEAHGHACQCKARGTAHQCDCAMCHRAAGAAPSAAPAATPPCHAARPTRAPPGGEARAVLAAAPSGPAAPSAPDAPCLSSGCGGEGKRLLPPPATERYTLPEATEVAPTASAERLLPPRPTGPRRVVEPETPPPRGC